MALRTVLKRHKRGRMLVQQVTSQAKQQENETVENLYLHIPFCSSLCHYCDFAKTANFNKRLTTAYFQQLAWHLDVWLAALPADTRFTTVYLGGGTPSLFTREYAPLFARLAPVLADDVEITLEANPQDITAAALAYWQDIGINRLSIGVQTFAEQKLRFLRRTHTEAHSLLALELASTHFAGETSIDLIYGMQTFAEWQRDLTLACTLVLTHISCYSLTYEQRTPLGRAVARGKLMPLAEERVAEMYEYAVVKLADAGFLHYEVSNWGKKPSKHNLSYWQDKSYLGIGSGAHGYLASANTAGIRYYYTPNERIFSRSSKARPSCLQARCLPYLLSAVNIDTRGNDAWLLEYLATRLRTCMGVDLAHISKKTTYRFSLTSLLAEGFANQHLSRTGDILHLAKSEWLRENYWLLHLLKAFR